MRLGCRPSVRYGLKNARIREGVGADSTTRFFKKNRVLPRGLSYRNELNAMSRFAMPASLGQGESMHATTGRGGRRFEDEIHLVD